MRQRRIAPLQADQAQFWRSEKWQGVELMRAHWVHHTFPKHFHDCYTIGINDGGAGKFECREKSHEASAGGLNLIEPGETHTGQACADSGWMYRDFYISVECMRELTRQVEINRVLEFRSATVDDPDLANHFRQAFDSMSATAIIRLEQDYLLLKAIRRLCARHAGRRTSDNARLGMERLAVSRIRDCLHAHCLEEITTLRLGNLVGWSPYHLIRAFHREMGMPPHVYQNTLRVNAAQKQLREGKEINDVALACGFYDQSHMNRLFRRVVGTTPGQYRERAISSKT